MKKITAILLQQKRQTEASIRLQEQELFAAMPSMFIRAMTTRLFPFFHLAESV